MTVAVAPAPQALADDAGFGIYIHWPFCLAKCPYCDFNSHVRAGIDEAAWRRALVAEIDHFAARAPDRVVTSVFFGGGTPSLMAPATVAALIDRIARRWRLAEGVEITLEANPTSVEAARLAGYRTAGVNRVSLGVQSLNNQDLRALGRNHDAAQARAAIESARALFPRLSFDLIYARPGQTVAAWRAELGAALALAADHLSLYQLTVETGTAFRARLDAGTLILPGDDLAVALYDATQELCDAAGLPAYEISNHAAPGAESRHNLTYWRSGDYVGIGPGAHGRLSRHGTTVATRQIRSPERWLAATERDGHGNLETVALSADDRLAEVLMMGLRLAEGVPRARIPACGGRRFDEALPAARLAPLIAAGLLDLDDDRLRATPAGWRVLNAVIAELLS